MSLLSHPHQDGVNDLNRPGGSRKMV